MGVAPNAVVELGQGDGGESGHAVQERQGEDRRRVLLDGVDAVKTESTLDGRPEAISLACGAEASRGKEEVPRLQTISRTTLATADELENGPLQTLELRGLEIVSLRLRMREQEHEVEVAIDHVEVDGAPHATAIVHELVRVKDDVTERVRLCCEQRFEGRVEALLIDRGHDCEVGCRVGEDCVEPVVNQP
jgi:hypothetical protein